MLHQARNTFLIEMSMDEGKPFGASHCCLVKKGSVTLDETRRMIASRDGESSTGSYWALIPRLKSHRVWRLHGKGGN